MKSIKYLEQLRDQLDKKTDAELAKTLNVTKSAISQYLSQKRVMDDETCLAVAMALDVNPMLVIGAACIDRAEKTGQKSLWEVFMSKTAQAASVVVAVGLVATLLTPTPSRAASRLSEGGNQFTLCQIKYVS